MLKIAKVELFGYAQPSNGCQILVALDCIYAEEHATHRNGCNGFSVVLVACNHSAQPSSLSLENSVNPHCADYGDSHRFVERRMAMAYDRVDPGRTCWDLLWLQAWWPSDRIDATYVLFVIGMATLASIPVSVTAVVAGMALRDSKTATKNRRLIWSAFLVCFAFAPTVVALTTLLINLRK